MSRGHNDRRGAQAGPREWRSQRGSRARREESLPRYLPGRPEDPFTCSSCGQFVAPAGAGTAHRNHCPACLASLHLDNEPGDRAAWCGGVMEAVAIWVRKGGEWAIIHRCRECGRFSSNRIAADDNEALLLSLAVRPLSRPPFPLDRLARGGVGAE